MEARKTSLAATAVAKIEAEIDLGIDNGQWHDELEQLDGATYVCTGEYQSSRWIGYQDHIYKFSDGSYLAVTQAEGLTEMQDGFGVCEVYEVVQKPSVKYVALPD